MINAKPVLIKRLLLVSFLLLIVLMAVMFLGLSSGPTQGSMLAVLQEGQHQGGDHGQQYGQGRQDFHDGSRLIVRSTAIDSGVSSAASFKKEASSRSRVPV